MIGAVARIASAVTVAALAQVGATSAANDTFAARDQIRFECEGLIGPTPSRNARGTCVVFGATTDRGKFRDDANWAVHPHGRTFASRKGTIQLSVYEERGHWRIMAGTGAYAGLRGRGWERTAWSGPGLGCTGIACTVSITMVGRVLH